MRPYRSITGPLILIGIGILFLLHTIAPDVHIWHFFADYWPYLLIIWGVLQLIEVLVRARGPNAAVGITGGGWFIVFLIIMIGLASSNFRHPQNWWQYVGAEHGLEVFGNAHDFSLSRVQKDVGKQKRLVVEAFRGDVKIVGSNNDQLVVDGSKTVRTLNDGEAGRVNSRTPVDVVQDGDTVTIRCHQDAGPRTQVTTNLEITLPRRMAAEVNGTNGDFDVSGLNGDVALSSDNAGIRVKSVTGDVKVNTRRSDTIEIQQVKGTVSVEGHGDDVNISKVSGTTSISGDFTGQIRLAQIDKPVRVDSLRTHFNAESIPGEIGLERGSLDARDIVGPVKVDTEATDVTMNGVRNSLEVNDDRGDVQVAPGHLPLSSIAVHTKAGDIEFSVPPAAALGLTASTEHGDIENELGANFHQQVDGHRAKLEGSIGQGPDVVLTTDRGTITVRKGDAKSPAAKVTKDDNDQSSEI